MLNCESGFHQSKDKRKLNCHKLRSSYVTSILITKLTFAMFLLKLSTLSAAIFLFVSLVLSLLCGRLTGLFHSFTFFFQYSLSDVDIRHLFVSFIRFFYPESRSSLAFYEYLLECQTIRDTLPTS